ncbi:SpaA isopeptide-forming pilin-related protein [Leifsonia sp. NPDC077715]|uniref:MSCRAMM family protein n=1 Tax=Leifsonia sp. NPDC077715 TaxID=3155539 RepID=UPI00342BDE56
MMMDRSSARTRKLRWAMAAVAVVACSALGVALGIGALPERYSHAADVPTVTCATDPNIFSTGYVQSTRAVGANGAVDERWMIAAGTGGAGLNPGTGPAPQGPLAPSLPGTPTYASAYVGKSKNEWVSSPYSNAQWISNRYVSPASGGSNQTGSWGNFYYRFTFTLDPVVVASAFSVSMDWYADNTVRGVWVNSNLKAQTQTKPYDRFGFQAGQQVSAVLTGFVTGRNEILVQVGSTVDAEGLLAQARSTSLCPTASPFTLTKTVNVGRVAAADQFTVSAVSSSKLTIATATTTGTGLSATANGYAEPGTYTISDTLAAGSTSTAKQYKGVLTCTNRTDASKPPTITGAYPTWSVTIPTGTPQSYLCTVTNSSKTFTVAKSVNPAPPAIVAAGQKVTYSVVVTNAGRTAFTSADAATFTDNLSGVLDDATYNGDVTGGATIAGTTLSWSGALAVGAKATITYSVTVKQPGAGDGNLVNTVTGGPSCTSQCTATTQTPVRWYEAVKTASPASALPGDTVRYTVTVKNPSRSDYPAGSPATFTDDLSKVLDDATYNRDVTGGATLTGTVLSWSGPLRAGETVTITYSVTVNSPVKGDRSMVNTVVTSSGGGNCATGSTDKRCTVTVTVVAGDVVWRKVDATPNHNLLAGSVWKFAPADGSGAEAVVDDCVKAPCAGPDVDSLSGQLRLSGLRPGQYLLTETRAPVGFQLATTPIMVTIAGGTVATLDPVVNEQMPAPILPLTGGVGADAYTIAGGLVAGLAALLGAVHVLNRRRLS